MMSSAWQGLLLALLVSSPALAATTDASSCSCGFYDESAKLLFTDSTIVYFNESDSVPSDFVVEEFAHRYDRGWNNMYRQGAAVDNVQLVNDTTFHNLQTLQLACDPPQDDHLVVGSSIRTARQDLFFGSFRSTLRPARRYPDPYQKGSVISMSLTHNQTESWQLDVMNTNNASQAWIDMLMQGQFANTWLGTNFTNLTQEGLNPWLYLEYRVDWTRDSLNYYINDVLQISYNKSVNSSIPSTPAPLHFQHWSLGNKYTSMGPPDKTNLANIGYTRLFFNSSTWNDTQKAAFDQSCSIESACRMDDVSLRGSSDFTSTSLDDWKQHQPPYRIKWAPLIIDIIMAAVFIVLTGKTLWRRFSWHKLMIFLGVRKREPPTPKVFSPTDSAGRDSHQSHESTGGSGTVSPSHSNNRTNISRNESFATLPPYKGTQTPLPQYQSPVASRRPSLSNIAENSYAYPASLNGTVQGESSRAASRAASLHGVPYLDQPPHSTSEVASPNAGATSEIDPYSNILNIETSTDKNKQVEAQAAIAAKETPAKTAEAKAAAAASAKPPRIDYLAGFISISAILVTVNHFGLTYFGAVIMPGNAHHYYSEVIARKTFATYFLDPLWIGPFLMISTRFLSSNYIRTGKLDNMAQKVVARPFRLLTPVASIALLEYFLMDAGALNWLEYLPSVTWSDWPFTAITLNPGIFVSEILQLAFLIPNGAPMITSNYCTGVLWTIPVQLQGAWQTLLGLIMIRQIKTPWKRFSFYAFCVVMHWYALSWGSYYYIGILFADLDLTYKYKQNWLKPRPWVYWPLLILMICVAIGGFSIDLVTQHTGINYASAEYGWHPDAITGLSLSQADGEVYPDYFVPRLNAFLATISMQGVVEISTTLQKGLSIKLLQWIFPHIFSIYLIHGFIMWSVGSWAMISTFSKDYPYWLCTLITAIVSYGTIFAVLPLLTPPIEALGKGFTQRLWQFASMDPVERKPTTYPFGKELLTKRDELTGNSKPASLEGISPSHSSSDSGTITVLNEKSEKSKYSEMTVRELKSSQIKEHVNEF